VCVGGSMTQFSLEITGRIEVRHEAYLAELSNQELSEPRLIALRRNLGENSIGDASRDQVENMIEAELYELLRAYEGSIAQGIRSRLEAQEWRGRRRGIIHEEHEPLFQVSVRFSRGSLLYTLVVTFLETFGPTIVKTGLASLVVAAVEPILLDKVRDVCRAANSMSTYVRDVVVQSVAQPVAGQALTWADGKLRETNDRLDQLIKKLDETRTYRRVRAFMLVVLGLVMANFIALAAFARKLGFF
jgi:ribosomal protein S13